MNLIQTASPTAAILSGGDFNDFTFYRPLEAATGYVFNFQDRAETLTGATDAETIDGFGGDDTLDGTGAGDTLIGGTGDDRFIVDGLDDVVIEFADEGDDKVRTFVSTHVLPDEVERLTYTGSAAGRFTGSAGDNALTGGDGADGFVFARR